MVVSVSFLSLAMSFFAPWYTVVALAAGVYSFRRRNHAEILWICGSIFTLHFLVAGFLDFQSQGFIGLRMGGLFSSPRSLIYFLNGLIPALLFGITAYMVIEGRSLVKRSHRKTEKKA